MNKSFFIKRTMKLLNLTFILISILFFGSCSSDDDPVTGGGGTTTQGFDDWNNPSSPNYKPQGYNPIVGEWIDGSIKYIYTNDFNYTKGLITSDGLVVRETATYSINDKQIKYSPAISFLNGTRAVWDYKIEGNTLTLSTEAGQLTFTRVQ